jgi:hypothetical protein
MWSYNWNNWNWQFWLLLLIFILMILWIFMGGKKYEFVGIRPLSTSVDSRNLLDPQTIANLTNAWTQPITVPDHGLGLGLGPDQVCPGTDRPGTPCNLPTSLNPATPRTPRTPRGQPEVVIDATPDLPPEFTTPAEEAKPDDPFARIVIPPFREGSSKGEEICCRVLEDLYGVPFVKTRPNFLQNPETGKNLELDCYNERLGLAVEYNGEQHYKFPNVFHRSYEDFIKQVRRDRFKLDMCDANNIYLITVPYNVPHSKIRDFIIYYLPENVTARMARQQPQPQVTQHTLI